MVGRRLGGYSRLSRQLSEDMPQLNKLLSESSYEGSSTLSGDCYQPPTVSTVAPDFPPDVVKGSEGDGGGRAASTSGSGSASRSWAQQAEEAYQLQLAFALRLCSQAATIAEPNFLDAADQLLPPRPVTSESLSHRFWVYI